MRWTSCISAKFSGLKKQSAIDFPNKYFFQIAGEEHVRKLSELHLVGRLATRDKRLNYFHDGISHTEDNSGADFIL
jgi:hypothetical protein